MPTDPSSIILQAGNFDKINPAQILEAGQTLKLRQLATTRAEQTQAALDRVRSNPDDPDAVTQLAALDPAAGQAYLASQNARRAGVTRASQADLIRAMPTLGSLASGTAPAQSAAQLQSLTAGNSAAAPIARPTSAAGVGNVSAPAVPSPAAAQLSPTSPAMVATGQAVAAGISPTEAAARVVQSGGADALNEVIKSYNALDDVRKSKLEEGNTAAGQAALSLLNVPQAQRAQALAQLAPSLAQHFITPDKLGDLSDTTLHGVVGQATTIAEGIKQANSDRDYALDVRKQSETERHNVADESKPVSASFGSSLINPKTGAVVFDANGNATGGSDVNSKIAALEGTSRSPLSSANGPGQFVNSTFRQYIASASPEIAQQVAGMSDAQLTAFRTANASMLAPIQQKMLPTLTAANQQALTAAGVPVTDGNTYLAHVFGPTGAAAALKADPNAKAADLIGGQKALTNNGLPPNATVAQVKSWADRKMEGAGASSASVPTSQRYSNGAGGVSYDGLVLAAKEGMAHGGVVPQGYARNKAAQAAITNIMGEMGSGKDVGGIIQGGQTTKSQGAAFQTWNSGKPNTGAAQTRSIGVAVDHIDQLAQAAGALNNGNTPIFNQVAQAYAKATGKAAPTNFSSVKDFVLDEVTKAIIGAGGGVGDREKAAQIVNNWQSPAQSAGAIKQLQGLMAGQLHGLSAQYEQTTGRNDFQRYVSPRAAKVLGLSQPGRINGTLSANTPSAHPADIQAILDKYR